MHVHFIYVIITKVVDLRTGGEIVKTALIIALLVISVILAIVVIMQEGKGGGLTSSISGGGSDTYWSKNKGKSKEAKLKKLTIVLGILYMGLALFISSKFMK